jgi:hypothetical protein
MKTKSPLKDLTLIQIILRFDTDEKARKHLESVLWKREEISKARTRKSTCRLFDFTLSSIGNISD